MPIKNNKNAEQIHGKDVAIPTDADNSKVLMWNTTLKEFVLGSSTSGGSYVTETPSGLINSSNVTYTLTSNPAPNSLILVLDGMVLEEDGDFTLSSSTITFVTAPTTGSKLLAVYPTVSATIGVNVATDTIFDAKGDLVVGTGSDTSQKLTVGADGSVPVADSSETTGLKYVNAKRTILLSGAGGWASTTNGDAGITQVEMTTNDVDIVGVSFPSSASAAYHQYSLVMPDNYDGSTVTARFHWMTNDATPTGDVSWKIQGQAYTNDNPLDAAWGTAIELVDTIIAQNDLHISADSGAITIANTPAGGKMVQFRVYRDGADASDTSSNDVILLGVLISYGTDNYPDV